MPTGGRNCRPRDWRKTVAGDEEVQVEFGISLFAGLP
jgi:hypothetical protein